MIMLFGLLLHSGAPPGGPVRRKVRIMDWETMMASAAPVIALAVKVVDQRLQERAQGTAARSVEPVVTSAEKGSDDRPERRPDPAIGVERADSAVRMTAMQSDFLADQ